MIAATALALSLLAPTAAPGQHPRSQPVSGNPRAVDLDLGGLEPLDPGVRSDLAIAIHRALAELIAKHDLEPGELHVDVSWRDQDDVDYAVRIRMDALGGLAVSEYKASTGPDATARALADAIAAAVQRGVDDRARARNSVEPTPAPSAPQITTPHEAPPPARPQRWKPSAVGWTGIVLASVGAASLGAGIGMVVVSPTIDPRDATRLRDWRYAGYTMIGLGALAVATGSAMAIVDAKGRRVRTVAVRPFMGRRGGGLTLRLRF